MKIEEIAITAARAADEKNAENIILLDVSELLVITDYFLICSGATGRQVRTITDNIREKIRKKGLILHGVEGEDRAEWVLVDYGDIVIHVFTEEQHEYYQLERLWRDAPVIEWAKKSKAVIS